MSRFARTSPNWRCRRRGSPPCRWRRSPRRTSAGPSPTTPPSPYRCCPRSASASAACTRARCSSAPSRGRRARRTRTRRWTGRSRDSTPKPPPEPPPPSSTSTSTSRPASAPTACPGSRSRPPRRRATPSPSRLGSTRSSTRRARRRPSPSWWPAGTSSPTGPPWTTPLEPRRFSPPSPTSSSRATAWTSRCESQSQSGITTPAGRAVARAAGAGSGASPRFDSSTTRLDEAFIIRSQRRGNDARRTSTPSSPCARRRRGPRSGSTTRRPRLLFTKPSRGTSQCSPPPTSPRSKRMSDRGRGTS
mmetsp:Transcript_14498/g.59149  ORF Transcript_14498/g.59149 Transcript_14498/m.59149 type:complete len:304 (-) Transcript_14498:312-1223(-)